MLFFQSLFSVIYRFYVSVFREKEIPHYFAGIGTSFFIVSIYANIMSLFFLYTGKEWVFQWESYSKYFSLGLAVLSIPYVSKKNRYKKILGKIDALPVLKRRILIWLNIVFMIGSIALYFTLSEYVRDMIVP